VGNLTPEQVVDVEKVKSITAPVMGFTRSYWDFHVGFGLFISLMLCALAIVCWQLGVLVKTEPRTARFVAAVLALCFAASVPLDFMFFFWAPIVFSVIIALCLIGAAVSIKTRQNE
jgi:hypothetical protein